MSSIENQSLLLPKSASSNGRFNRIRGLKTFGSVGLSFALLATLTYVVPSLATKVTDPAREIQTLRQYFSSITEQIQSSTKNQTEVSYKNWIRNQCGSLIPAQNRVVPFQSQMSIAEGLTKVSVALAALSNAVNNAQPIGTLELVTGDSKALNANVQSASIELPAPVHFVESFGPHQSRIRLTFYVDHWDSARPNRFNVADFDIQFGSMDRNGNFIQMPNSDGLNFYCRVMQK